MLGAPPAVTNPLAVVEVEDGLPLNYTIPDDTFQLNKPYGNLTLSGILQGGGSLPSWLSIDASGGALTLFGTPSFGFDQSYLLDITATDSDGAQNSTSLQLEVRAACPAGLFRHFRYMSADAIIWTVQIEVPEYLHLGLPDAGSSCSQPTTLITGPTTGTPTTLHGHSSAPSHGAHQATAAILSAFHLLTSLQGT